MSIWRLRQEDCEFRANLDHIAIPCLIKQSKTKKTTSHIGAWLSLISACHFGEQPVPVGVLRAQDSR